MPGEEGLRLDHVARSGPLREEGGEAAPAEEAAPAADAPVADAPAVEAPAAAAAEDVTTESGTKIPAHLLERAKRRKAAAVAQRA